MFRLFVSFALLIFMAIVSIGGCDGGGMGDGSEPTPIPTPVATSEPTPPPDVSEACSNCPCDFFSVPMTTGCWPRPEFRTGDNPNNYTSLCTLAPREGFYGYGMGILSTTNCNGPGGFGCCVVFTSQDDSPLPPTCIVSRALESLQSNQEVEDCLTCLEHYASELNNAVRNGVIGGPPYKCVGP